MFIAFYYFSGLGSEDLLHRGGNLSWLLFEVALKQDQWVFRSVSMHHEFVIRAEQNLFFEEQLGNLII